MPPLLGWIEPSVRNRAQQDAHADAVGKMVKFALPIPVLAKGDRIALFDAWKHPDVVADVGFTFDRFHQLTGSCVGCGGGNGLFSTIATQRLASDAPTKAFLPFWPAPYGLSRHIMGDDGQGEGSLGSTFAEALRTGGIRDWPQGGGAGMPTYTDSDGVTITTRDEMQWSSYRNANMQTVLSVSQQHLIGSTAECKNVTDVRAMISNGYGVTFACNNYIGSASIQGSGADACVVGYWNGNGGHQQSAHAVWEHPNLGPLYWVQNNWPGSTYPKDPAGGPTCGCWVTEAHVTAAFRLDAEVFGLSHLNWFPAQPKVPEVLNWAQI